MSLLKTAKLGHPIIRHKARTLPVDELMSPDVQRFINDMIETMRDQAAVGIAANQVYSDKCIVVIEVRGDNPRYAERDKIPVPPCSGTKLGSGGEAVPTAACRRAACWALKAREVLPGFGVQGRSPGM
jgi:hypothetical protein